MCLANISKRSFVQLDPFSTIMFPQCNTIFQFVNLYVKQTRSNKSKFSHPILINLACIFLWEVYTTMVVKSLQQHGGTLLSIFCCDFYLNILKEGIQFPANLYLITSRRNIQFFTSFYIWLPKSMMTSKANMQNRH